MRSKVWLPFLLGVAVPAFAQAPQGTPARLRGTIVKFDGHTLTITTRGGQTVKTTLAPHFAVRGVARKTLADIKPGDYVASSSVRGADGMLHALEIHVLPDSMRGVGEGSALGIWRPRAS